MIVGAEAGRFIRKLCIQGLIEEVMTSISWHCTTRGPNLHVVQAHLERSPTTL